MSRMGENTWGKSSVRVSKVHGDGDGFSEVTVGVHLSGEVEAAYRRGDNSAVIPTDTMRNTIYVIAHDSLDADLEAFATAIATHFLAKEEVEIARVTVEGRRWEKVAKSRFLGGSGERRLARVVAAPSSVTTAAGIDGLLVLKTTDSSFAGFPRDPHTTLAETDERILSTTVHAEWTYDPVPPDTTATWEKVRAIALDRFFSDASASVQHQGWMMAEAILDEVPEIADVTLRLPNQHHLGFDVTRFGITGPEIVFHPVDEPYGDVSFTAHR